MNRKTDQGNEIFKERMPLVVSQKRPYLLHQFLHAKSSVRQEHSRDAKKGRSTICVLVLVMSLVPKYQIIDKLGFGVTSTVWLVHDLE